jgi:nucleoside permease NupC
LDAATKGAMLATQLVLGIIANLIAFVSFIAFFNGMLSWFGMLLGFEGLSLEVRLLFLICIFICILQIHNRKACWTQKKS